MVCVSIIIPVYNVKNYLERCLDSVTGQTLKDIEIILVNDGSTDGSPEICEKYAKEDSRIRIVTQKNSGLACARNTGLRYVTGEYVGFVDSDDWVDLKFFEKLYRYAKNYDADIAYADFVRKGKNKHKLRMKFSGVEVSENINDKIRRCKNLTLGCVWNKIYRRKLIFDNNLTFPDRLFEDGLFSMQAIFYANKTVSVPGVFYYYFINPKSIVKSAKTQKKIDDVILTQHDILNFIYENNIEIPAGEFMTVAFKLRLWLLTLWVVKEDLYIKRYYLFGSIPVLTINKSNSERICGNLFGIKFYLRKNLFSKEEIIRRNAPYENRLKLVPLIRDKGETIQALVKTNKSICRFGDGEFNLILGEGIGFQNKNFVLEKRLKEILSSNDENIMIAIPDIFGSLDMDNNASKSFWRKFLVYNREKIYDCLDFSKTYYDSMITRVYIRDPENSGCKKVFDDFKRIWDGKDIVFVEGKASRLGVGNDLFSNAKSIRRILCPQRNAYSKYDEILDTCRELPLSTLFIIALGPAATVLAYDLAKSGYRALDLGHLDIEYEWYLMGAKKKVPVKNKYVNEADGGKVITVFNDKKYLEEIYKDLSNEG